MNFPYRSLLSPVIPQRAEKNIYLIIEYCSGGDLTNYIKKRGRVEGLQYAPYEGAKLQYYEHPRTGGLDEAVVRCFLRQLGKSLSSEYKDSSLILSQPGH